MVLKQVGLPSIVATVGKDLQTNVIRDNVGQRGQIRCVRPII